MSHRASHWLAELAPNLINNGAFRVLFHLCDAHNSKRAPHEACFPSQGTLRGVTGLSNGGLNNSLNTIEKAGLLRRRRTRMPDGTKGPTYYILGCDVEMSPEPTPESGDGTNSKNEGKPSPNSGMNHLQWSGDKPVREPVIEPVSKREPKGSPKNTELAVTKNTALMPKQKRGASIPESWVPSDKNIEDARKQNLTDREIDHEADRFRDYHLARGTVFKNWDAAWRTWVSNAKKWGKKNQRSSNQQAADLDTESFLRQNDEAARIAIARYQSRS